MRKTTWIPALAATGLLAAGAAAPAIAAAGHAPGDSTTSSPQHGMENGNGMQNMGQMHKQMMQNMPEMADMHQNMMQEAPGMAKMHMQMMGEHSGEGTTSDDKGDDR